MSCRKSFRSSSGKASQPKTERTSRNATWLQSQSSDSSQISSYSDLNSCNQFLSLYNVMRIDKRIELAICNIKTGKRVVKKLNTKLNLDDYSSITELPNGELFCNGSLKSGIALIIDKNYKVRMLPSGTDCYWSSALYFDNNIYCFGGCKNGYEFIDLSRKFDLKENRWINLAPMAKAIHRCHSVLFNGNILISGYQSKTLQLYSIEINSFSKIPYRFADKKIKFLINAERLYLIEWGEDGSIYESEDEYSWQQISKSGNLLEGCQMDCLYNKEKIYVSAWNNYYIFDLKKKVVLNFEC